MGGRPSRWHSRWDVASSPSFVGVPRSRGEGDTIVWSAPREPRRERGSRDVPGAATSRLPSQRPGRGKRDACQIRPASATTCPTVRRPTSDNAGVKGRAGGHRRWTASVDAAAHEGDITGVEPDRELGGARVAPRRPRGGRRRRGGPRGPLRERPVLERLSAPPARADSGDRRPLGFLSDRSAGDLAASARLANVAP